MINLLYTLCNVIFYEIQSSLIRLRQKKTLKSLMIVSETKYSCED